jgi:1-acyl-sn-glycerol-3-phosphate acyltransferase
MLAIAIVALGAARLVPRSAAPDLIRTRMYTKEVDEPVLRANRALTQGLKAHIRPVCFTGVIGSQPRARVALSAATAPMPESRPPRGIERIRFSSKLNAFGLLFALNALFLGTLMLLPMYIVSPFDARRTAVTRLGNVWGRLVMRATGIRATISGAELLPPPSEPIMYVANHCSYLDIPVTALLRRPIKYISKSEVLKLPVIGAKLKLAKDLCVTRGDRRSEARVFIDAVRYLKGGESVLAFPEGTTTTTGQLLPFKRGPFKMALSAAVRIVPLTIRGTYDAWPKESAGPSRNVPLSIQVHPPLDIEGKSEEELCEAARAAVQSGLDS